MCTVIALRRPDHEWPVVLAANRDEMVDRPWAPPARHWRDRSNVVAGIDRLAGGTWLGLNDEGVVAAVLNRRDSLGPDPLLRSRGELVLEALDHADADAASDALSQIDSTSYRSFNMVIADNRDGFWLRSTGAGAVEVHELPTGLSMVTSADLNDPASPRLAYFRPKFASAPVPDPERGDWSSWQTLLASTEHAPGTGPHEAMCIFTEHGFATVSSALIALPAMGLSTRRPVWLFAAGAPSEVPFLPVTLDANNAPPAATTAV